MHHFFIVKEVLDTVSLDSHDMHSLWFLMTIRDVRRWYEVHSLRSWQYGQLLIYVVTFAEIGAYIEKAFIDTKGIVMGWRKGTELSHDN